MPDSTDRPPRLLRFAEFALDLVDERLTRADEAVHLTPKAFQTLRHLAERPGALVTKHDLLAAVWADTAVSDDALTRCIGELRRVLGDDARSPRFLATVHRRGFRWLMRAAGDSPGALRNAVYAGREAELSRALGLLAEALAGRSQIALISGEPGVGKTRLAEEIAAAARALGALALVSRAHEGEGSPPFWMWIQVLRAYARELSPAELRALAGASLADLAELLPELRERATEAGPRAALGFEEARIRVFDAVTRLLVDGAARRPLVLILDDVHTADPDSLALLGYLGRELANARLLLVATYRDVGSPPNPALDPVLAELARARDGRALISLRGLDRDGVESLLAGLTDREIAARFAATAHEKTGGNPLYLHELVRLLGESHDATPPDSWMVETPETVRQVLTRRLAALSPPCRGALALAAVAGLEFSERILHRAAESSQADLADGLGEAEAERLVFHGGDGDALRFAHGLVREIVYEGLRPGERARLHRRIAQALEAEARRSGDAPLAELAHHFGKALLGGDVEKAIHYGVLAGEQAFAVQAFEEAATHFGAALDALEASDPADPERTCRAALAAGYAHDASGRPARARELARIGLGRAREAGSPLLIAAAVTALCEFQPDHRSESDVIALLDDALERLGDTDLAARARLLAERGYRSYVEADPLAQARFSREAVELARRSGDPGALLLSLRNYCSALLHPSREAEWRATYEEVIQLARAQGNRADELEGLAHRLSHHMQLSLPDEVERDLAEIDSLAARLRTPTARCLISRMRAAQAIARGDLVAGRRFAEAALTAGRQSDAEMAQLIGLLQLGSIAVMEGNVPEVASELQAGARANTGIALLKAGEINLLAQMGAHDEARRRLDALADTNFSALRPDSTYTIALSNLALSYGLLSHTSGADRLYELLLPYAGRTLTFVSWYSSGCMSRFLAILAGALGRFDTAEQHFETALAVDERMQARTWQAECLVQYARMCRARGAAGDGARANQLLRDARKLAGELGIVSTQREATALLE